MAITSSIAPTADPVYIDPSTTNDLGDKDIFLKLLVAQMEYQDPMDPQDATQMSSQLAQYNAVEQQIQTNDLLTQLVNNSGTGSSTATGTGADYLGHSVTINQNSMLYDGTAQNFDVVLDNSATDALAFIFDANGNPVRTMTLSNLSPGSNNISWDGLTDSGTQAAQGNYTVDVAAADANGNEVGSSIQRSGVVDAVRFTSTGTELVVGGIATSADKITEIRL